jgi:hypothetical protein
MLMWAREVNRRESDRAVHGYGEATPPKRRIPSGVCANRAEPEVPLEAGARRQ